MKCFALICLLTAVSVLGCGGPPYQVRPDRVNDAARYKGTYSSQSSWPARWYAFSIESIDGKQGKTPYLISSEPDELRLIESGEHVVVLRCEGVDDYNYHARVAAQVDFLPNTIYIVNGRITPDRIFFWIEREDTKDKVTPEMRAWRDDTPISGMTFFPAFAPK